MNLSTITDLANLALFLLVTVPVAGAIGMSIWACKSKPLHGENPHNENRHD